MTNTAKTMVAVALLVLCTARGAGGELYAGRHIAHSRCGEYSKR